MDALKGEVIEGQGNSEQAWAQSAVLEGLAVANLEDLLANCARLVVVAPHPDDEVLGCGGLMAQAIQSGMEVIVVSLTDGEAAYLSDQNWQPQQLASVRRRELVNAVRALGSGASKVVHVGIPDGKIGEYISQAVAALGFIKRSDAVLVTWAKDGHPDHEAAAVVTQRVCQMANARLIQYPIWAWHWSDPAKPQFLDAGARKFFPSSQALAMKSGAIAAFGTQVGTCVPPPVEPILPPHVLRRFQRPFEVYLT